MASASHVLRRAASAVINAAISCINKMVLESQLLHKIVNLLFEFTIS
jgi:hypothetical protein